MFFNRKTYQALPSVVFWENFDRLPWSWYVCWSIFFFCARKNFLGKRFWVKKFPGFASGFCSGGVFLFYSLNFFSLVCKHQLSFFSIQYFFFLIYLLLYRLLSPELGSNRFLKICCFLLAAGENNYGHKSGCGHRNQICNLFLSTVGSTFIARNRFSSPLS